VADECAVGMFEDGASVLEAWSRQWGPDGPPVELPPHSAGCLGCGPENPHGHQLRARREGDTVVCQHVFDSRHVGAPGIAHGGAVAAVVDDLYGMLLFVVGSLAVTRRLEVEYLRPVLLGREYSLTAWMERREGRKLHFAARVDDTQGQPVATSQALFLAVDPAHFTSSVSSPGHPDTAPVPPAIPKAT
jgi:acyl-coenzyme A thioesterase PaaI-like protein